MGKPKKPKHDKKYSKQPPMADSADRHLLYEQSVQNTDSEIEFLRTTFRSVRGRPATSLREDFCGTATTACTWVKEDARHTAIGIDIDPDVLNWSRDHNVSQLTSDEQRRLQLVQSDVMEAEVDCVDLAVALNFSYWLFKDRDTLRRYFTSLYNKLNDDGLFAVDAFGGSESMDDDLEEETEHDGFTYIWEQQHFDPITHDLEAHIHFDFPDGSKIKRAFSYHWRFWTLPEIQELLKEAGFSQVTVYWDMSDDDEDSDHQPAERGETDPAWIAYIIAEK